MMLAARGAIRASGAGLPYDAEVEYLESSGTQYVNTDTIDDPVNNLAQITFSIPTSTGATMNLFGSSGSRFNYVSARWGSSRYNLGPSASTTPVLPISVGDIHVGTYTLINNELTYTLDGESAVYSSSLVYDDLPFAIFGIYGRPDASPFIGRVYDFKVIRKSDGTVIADYIPVRKKTVGYLYDRVTRKLFGNAGTGDFALGPEVVPVEYIESHGTEYIDTGVEYIDSMDLECTFSCSTSEASSKFAFGVYGGGTSRQCAFSTYRYWNTASAQAIFYKGSGFKTLPNNATNTVSRVSGVWRYNGEAVEDAYVFDNAEHLNMYLFAGNTVNVGASYFFIGRMSGFKLTNNGTSPVCKFQPVRVGTGSTWEGAMMDTLTRRIYRNAGTGAFTYGNDLKYPIPA